MRSTAIALRPGAVAIATIGLWSVPIDGSISKLCRVKQPEDPLAGLGSTLVCALLAQALSVLLAAVLASRSPGGYRVRSWVFLGAVLWSLAGTVLLLIQTNRGTARTPERGIGLVRIGLWVASVWVWPILVRRRPPS